MINTLIQQFENDLVALVNGADIPIACKKHVMANVYHEIEKAMQRVIEAEASEPVKEEQTDGV